ncbi:uncharacterized protein N0V89_009155 [Didymosphaeria variabile]|uniref:Uncharacterized protein n=1 Tax=Didymosphaeria variabile TaxID=1932322 RepID=A0A9W8XJ32_9PLEO|nr:uncharacterized protein N0V89_009155 [Didymosphaeria variabile]KAJ4350534.1 hypothetical protein N0V89_009155 [Didymosphaeria variabile]
MQRQASLPTVLSAPFDFNSHPILSEQVPGEAHCDRQKAPLKSSLKYMSKSAAETPAEPATDPSNAAEHHRVSQSLRRVKTVDFKEAEATQIRTLPLSKPWLSDTIVNAFHEDKDKSQGSLSAKSRCAIRGEPSCSRLGTKGRPADPAVTKTDVHVVTRAPACEFDVLPHELDIVTATPTMQIVQSRDSCYEIVWDDVPAEDKQRGHRRSSVASLALRTASSATKDDLERVNSKLFEWDWGRGPDLESFAPQIVVFPDDQGHAHGLTSTTDGDEDASMRAPPNNQRTSDALSSLPSTPATARPSRPPSQDEPGPVGELEADDLNDSDEGTVAALIVPDPEARPASLPTLHNDSKKPLEDRRFSNIDDSEVRFRGHRDSVTMARARLLANGRVSPEILEVRKYGTMAKRRMHAMNRGNSEEETAEANIATREPARSHEPACLASSSPIAGLGSSSPIMSRNSGVLWGFHG